MMKKRLTILEQIAVDVEVSENPFNFQLQDLFLMAARNNVKRAFLFVSKLLGKHIPVNPKRSILTGKLLGFLMNDKLNFRGQGYKVKGETERKIGGRGCKIEGESYNIQLIARALRDDRYIDEAIEYCENNLLQLNKSTLFIGFAETATALGNSVFSQFKGENILFIHTTRDELIQCTSAFDFEEEHSHATSHFCYPLRETILRDYERVVLVDDEITTGKTALNLISAINNEYPGKEYIVVSILDWRREKHINEYKELERELGVKIHEVSILDGEAYCDSPSIKGIEIQYENLNAVPKKKDIYEEFYNKGSLYKVSGTYISSQEKDETLVRNYLFPIERSKNLTRNLTNGELKDYKYLELSGRFGVTEKELQDVEKTIDHIVKSIDEFSEKTLVLGTEEFMYIPMLIASNIKGAKYQSTTRSPIYASDEEGYGIKCAAIFTNPFDKKVINYIYNVEKDVYDEVFFVTEREIDEESKQELTHLFQSVNINKINFLYFLPGHEEECSNEI